MVLLGTSSIRYRPVHRSHKSSCWCTAGFIGPDLVSLDRIYRRQNRGKCTPIRCRHRGRGLECIPDECRQLSTPRLGCFLLAKEWPIFPYRGWFIWVSHSRAWLQPQSVDGWRLEYRSRQFGGLLLVAAQKYHIPNRYLDRISSSRWVDQ